MIAERWARPVIPYDAEERQRIILIGGQRYDFPLWLLFEEDKERVRLGYVCIKCLTPHERPFPEQCDTCLLPMRAYQERLFDLLFIGQVDVGPQTTDEEELAIAKEMIEKKRHVAGAQILLPGRDFL